MAAFILKCSAFVKRYWRHKPLTSVDYPNVKVYACNPGLEIMNSSKCAS